MIIVPRYNFFVFQTIVDLKIINKITIVLILYDEEFIVTEMMPWPQKKNNTI